VVVYIFSLENTVRPETLSKIIFVEKRGNSIEYLKKVISKALRVST